jgi:hypothetical protein
MIDRALCLSDNFTDISLYFEVLFGSLERLSSNYARLSIKTRVFTYIAVFRREDRECQGKKMGSHSVGAQNLGDRDKPLSGCRNGGQLA